MLSVDDREYWANILEEVNLGDVMQVNVDLKKLHMLVNSYLAVASDLESLQYSYDIMYGEHLLKSNRFYE